MITTSPDSVAALDLTDPATFVQHDPRAFWRAVRAEQPIYWYEDQRGREGFWVLSRYADVPDVYRDAQTPATSSGVWARLAW